MLQKPGQAAAALDDLTGRKLANYFVVNSSVGLRLLSYSQNASRQEAPSEGSHVRVGGAPVTCITLVNENVWCGCGNNVVILDGR